MKKPTKPKPASERAGKTYQLKIELDGASPPIWRRVLVPGKTTLGHLHEIIQIVMSWENAHLHQFIVDKQFYSDPDFELNAFDDAPGVLDEGKTSLMQVAPRTGKVLIYEYDFGDSWRHRIKVEKILEQEPSAEGAAKCIDGARACPPEDCGGLWGYEDLIEALKDPRHEEHESAGEWLGKEFDPEAFDMEKANRALRRLK
jgi:hypothetical protein